MVSFEEWAANDAKLKAQRAADELAEARASARQAAERLANAHARVRMSPGVELYQNAVKHRSREADARQRYADHLAAKLRSSKAAAVQPAKSASSGNSVADGYVDTPADRAWRAQVLAHLRASNSEPTAAPTLSEGEIQ